MHTTGPLLPAIGCDVGGSSCKIGVVDSAANLLETAAFAVPDTPDLETFTANLFERLDASTSRYAIRGIGVLLPGYLRENRTVPDIMVNLRMLEGVPLARLLSERYPVAVVLDIDRNGPALAEYNFTFRGQISRLLYVSIGTGLGVGLVIDGSICRVCRDSVGELGHITLDPDGAPCGCGNLGCAETLLSIGGIRRIAQKLGLHRLLSAHSALEFPKALYLEAVAGCSEARQIFEEFGRYLGAALVTYANAYSPDVIVIGGGLSGASEFFLPAASLYLAEHWIERATKTIQVRKAGFGAGAGVIGAASLVLPGVR